MERGLPVKGFPIFKREYEQTDDGSRLKLQLIQRVFHPFLICAGTSVLVNKNQQVDVRVLPFFSTGIGSVEMSVAVSSEALTVDLMRLSSRFLFMERR